MESVGPHHGRELEDEARLRIDGEERAALLPSAEFLAVTVGGEPGDPVVVFIAWHPDFVEQPYPGTVLWQAAVRRFLRSPTRGDPGERFVRAAAAESLEQFTSFDRWLVWHDHQRQRRAEDREKRRAKGD